MNVLLIPSATLVSTEMQRQFGKIPAVLCPLDGTPIIELIYKAYSPIVDKILIVTCYGKQKIKEFLRHREWPVELIELDELGDLGDSIASGLDVIKKRKWHITKLFINFADTLVDVRELNEKRDIVLYSKAQYDPRWTYFDKDKNQYIYTIKDKAKGFLQERHNDQLDQIFVGTFVIGAFYEFYFELQKAKQVQVPVVDSFWVALQSYSKRYKMEFLYVEEWIDIGHSDNYFKSKTNVEARNFNVLKIDKRRGIIEKTSKHKSKLKSEIEWYLKLPPNLQYVAPRIYDYSLQDNNMHIKMEYYGYPTLHELFVFGDLPLFQWNNIFKNLSFLINDFSNYSLKEADEVFRRNLNIMYVEKTVSRLCTLRESPDFNMFFSQPIWINGREYNSLDWHIGKIPEIVEKKLISNYSEEFCIIHGDLCFSNILLEKDCGFIRLIDPRGSFGDLSIYGDRRYELAKLLHSIEGGYDFIIEDLFSITISENKIDYLIDNTKNDLLAIFKRTFCDQMDLYHEIQLIEALLFLSMIPLHSDYSQRQYVMLAVGVELLSEALNEMC